MKPISTYASALERHLVDDQRVTICVADSVLSSESKPLLDKYPGQFFHGGVAEANLICAASGMWRMGLRPVVQGLAAFVLRRAYDQLVTQFAYPEGDIKLVGFRTGVVSLNGPSHHATDDVGLMRMLPHVTILDPCDDDQLRQHVDWMMQSNGPVYLRLKYGSLGQLALDPAESTKFGTPQVLAAGRDVLLVGSGLTISECVEARADLAREGVQCGIVNLHCLKPLDLDRLAEILAQYRTVVTVENGYVVNGIGSIISEVVAGRRLGVKVTRLGLQDRFADRASSSYRSYLARMGFDQTAIVAAVRQELALA